MDINYLPYGVKWRWKTMVNPTEDYTGGKILMFASLTNNKTLLAKNCWQLAICLWYITLV